jgi:hypothetical protein
MDTAFSPTLLLLGALMLGSGLYLIQRGRFLTPALMRRSRWLAGHPREARMFYLFLLTLGVLSGGMGCRILLAWLRS